MDGVGDNRYKSGKYFKQKYGMSTQTIRNWALKGHIKHLKWGGEGGKYVYLESDVNKYIGNTDKPKDERKTILYARVSSVKQKEDLERQRDDLLRYYPDHDKVVTDIGSGVNFQRKGLQTILDLIYEGMVKRVVVMHKDRLARIGGELLDGIFKKFGVQLVVHCKSQNDEDGKDSDLMSIITLFVASHNGKRAAKNKRRRGEEIGGGRNNEGSKKTKGGGTQ